jgi:hypothetical protein
MTKRNQIGNGIVYKDTKVAEGPLAEFNDKDNKADEIKDISNTVTSAGNNTANNTNNPFIKKYTLDNMNLISDRYNLHYNIYNMMGSTFQQAYKKVDALMPYVIMLLNTTTTTKTARIILADCDSEILKLYLQKPENYGPDIAQSGIYEALGLDKNDKISLTETTGYFPEFNELLNLKNRDVLAIKNPYQYLLCLPVETRAFYAGAVKHAIEKNGMVFEPSYENRDTFQRPLTTKHILDYAKEVGEVNKVADYVRIYNEGK